MTARTLARVLGLALAAATGGAAAATHINVVDCAVRSDYSLRTADGALLLRRTDGLPREIRLQDGRLWLDGREQSVPAEDRERLRHIEREADAMLAEARAMAEEGVTMALDAMLLVADELGADPALRAEIEAWRPAIGKAIDRLMQDPEAGEKELDQELDRLVSGLVPQIVGKLAAAATAAALSGEEQAARELGQRAEAMGKRIGAEMEARGKALEERASGLCERLERIDRLESGLGLRLPDGSPLDLVRVKRAP
ncbi:MAG: hypothetical protein KatS3mg126_1510 [Lysobacteraceae bacterium]|nr:MAG: hypothetical protein KatS3mg126_1510 [Xanthomonadaceae bacterium]